MRTLVKDKVQVQAKDVRFEGDVLFLHLSDGREISLPMHKIKWLKWLLKATPAERAKWTILPQGFGVYWEEFDDGFEVEHALSLEEIGTT